MWGLARTVMSSIRCDPLTQLLLWCYGSRGIAAHNMLWVLWLLWAPERAVPDPRCYGPRGHTELLAAGIFASRAAAREVRHRPPNIFSFALKLNSITSTCLLTEAERWLQISQSRPPSPSPPPSRNLLPVSNSYSLQLCRSPPF